jgi:hypothetical protein
MSWTDLKSRIADWLNRDDLSAQIPAFIALAEARFNRVLIVPEREAVAVLAAAGEAVALPADYWGMRALHVEAAPATTLRQMSLVELRRAYGGGTAGLPRHFAVRGSELLLGPAPASPCGLVLDYFQTIPALGEAQASNWLLDAHPDLYLSGALVEAYIFLRDAEGAGLWDSRTEAKIREVEKAGRRKTNGAAPIAARGPNPSIRQVRA